MWGGFGLFYGKISTCIGNMILKIIYYNVLIQLFHRLQCFLIIILNYKVSNQGAMTKTIANSLTSHS